LGLTLYLLLDSRARAIHPLLPACSGGIKGVKPPRAMATWEARVQAYEATRSMV